jgi:intein/homing endonuclease
VCVEETIQCTEIEGKKKGEGVWSIQCTKISEIKLKILKLFFFLKKNILKLISVTPLEPEDYNITYSTTHNFKAEGFMS